jgi:hypothetical protein
MKKVIFLGLISILIFLIGMAYIKKQNETATQPRVVEAKKNWVEISIFGQCIEEPWQEDANIKVFFKERGIEVHDIKIANRGPVCEACVICDSYEIKEILVNISDKDRIKQILNEFKES